MRGFDHRKPGKRRFGLGDAPADSNDGKYSATFPKIRTQFCQDLLPDPVFLLPDPVFPVSPLSIKAASRCAGRSFPPSADTRAAACLKIFRSAGLRCKGRSIAFCFRPNSARKARRSFTGDSPTAAMASFTSDKSTAIRSSATSHKPLIFPTSILCEGRSGFRMNRALWNSAVEHDRLLQRPFQKRHFFHLLGPIYPVFIPSGSSDVHAAARILTRQVRMHTVASIHDDARMAVAGGEESLQ
jgi:hypothetical protein